MVLRIPGRARSLAVSYHQDAHRNASPKLTALHPSCALDSRDRVIGDDSRQGFCCVIDRSERGALPIWPIRVDPHVVLALV